MILVKEIQEARFSLGKMEGLDLTQKSSFLVCIIGLPRLVLSVGALAAPPLITPEFTQGSLRSRTGSRGLPLGLRTATANVDMDNGQFQL
mgnify:CR=1 FL=1